jgi:cytochrome c biogenesis protein CcmG/thiol:disulfide interchange protein DsbE
MRAIVFFLPIILFSALGVAFMGSMKRDPSIIPSALIDRPVPEFSLPPISGRAFGLSSNDFAGEAAILNVFGSWCAACRVEHPVLMRIARSGSAPVYGLDWNDKPGAGARWLTDLGDPYARIGDDADGRIALELGVTGAPETFIVDKNGRIRRKIVGPITDELWRDELRPLIEELNNAP